MKKSTFQPLLKHLSLFGLAVVTFCSSTVTLTACSGGGTDEEEGGKGFKITNAQFASGQRGFSIQSNAGWEFWSDGHATDTGEFEMAPPDVDAGVLLTWGNMRYSFTGYRGQIIGLMRYNYDAAANKGTLRYSMDATNLDNAGGTETAHVVSYMINSIHGSKDAPGGSGGMHSGAGAALNDKGEVVDNIGEDIATHLQHTTIVFDFSTGTCQWTCGCGHSSHVMDFFIRNR